MLAKLGERDRLRDESGFTLIELLVVLIILGVLLAMAVPSYLGFKDRAERRAAAADVRAAVPAVETYYADDAPPNGVNTGGGSTYSGMDLAKLQQVDASVKLTTVRVDTVSLAGDSYCISQKVGSWFASKAGPSADLVTAKTTTDPCA